MISKKQLLDINYSVRRYLVDEFLNTSKSYLLEHDSILDIGGKKENKRGVFNIDDSHSNVKYVNIDASCKPDFLGSAYELPIPDKTFDVFILTEVLEHLEFPIKALEESHRILKVNGIGIITTPFMFHIHADPYDFNRPTKQWYISTLEKLGFEIILLKEQGGFWAVVFNELRFYLRFRLEKEHSGYKKKCLIFLHKRIIKLIEKRSLLDKKYQNSVLDGHTTGFGLIVRKR